MGVRIHGHIFRTKLEMTVVYKVAAVASPLRSIASLGGWMARLAVASVIALCWACFRSGSLFLLI